MKLSSRMKFAKSKFKDGEGYRVCVIYHPFSNRGPEWVASCVDHKWEGPMILGRGSLDETLLQSVTSCAMKQSDMDLWGFSDTDAPEPLSEQVKMFMSAGLVLTGR